MVNVILKKGRERSVLRGHPWLFSGAINKVEGHAQSGETVRVLDASGSFLAFGAYSPDSQIRVRIWSVNEQTEISSEFFSRRIKAAWQKRLNLKISEQSNAYRLLNAEADGLPGLIADFYDDFLVVQFLSAGSEFWKETIVRQLQSLFKPKGIYERSDVNIRKKEGLPLSKGLLTGEEPPDLVEIQEDHLHFYVDVKNGHKTGFYLDQRENRAVVAQFAKNREALNCFAYTGGFGLAALKAGAKKVVNVEAVGKLLTLIGKNTQLNGLDSSRSENVKGDVFKILRQFHAENRQFDLIVLDPPKFAEAQSHLKRAGRGYKDINLQAFKIIRPGGYLFTFSCSGLMKPDLFQKIVADAAIDAGREARVVRFLSQAADHPIVLSIPESLYLKGLLLQVW